MRRRWQAVAAVGWLRRIPAVGAALGADLSLAARRRQGRVELDVAFYARDQGRRTCTAVLVSGSARSLIAWSAVQARSAAHWRCPRRALSELRHRHGAAHRGADAGDDPAQYVRQRLADGESALLVVYIVLGTPRAQARAHATRAHGLLRGGARGVLCSSSASRAPTIRSAGCASEPTLIRPAARRRSSPTAAVRRTVSSSCADLTDEGTAMKRIVSLAAARRRRSSRLLRSRCTSRPAHRRSHHRASGHTGGSQGRFRSAAGRAGERGAHQPPLRAARDRPHSAGQGHRRTRSDREGDARSPTA